jgi:hypothetical protein
VHARFGEGVVVSTTDTRAVIRFASGERKLAHAPPSKNQMTASTSQPDARRAEPTSTPVAGVVVVRRLPPDPRLREPDAQEQFAHLARTDDDNEDGS